jgi:hypothetical protein
MQIVILFTAILSNSHSILFNKYTEIDIINRKVALK